VQGKTFLVTGAAGGIGKAIATTLAVKGAQEVCIVCRTEQQAKEVVDHITSAAGDSGCKVTYEVADLSLHSSVKNLAEKYIKDERPLHVLIANHATAPPKRTETAEGLEVQFAANVMGYYWLTHYFTPVLAKSAEASGDYARVVLVASYWAGGLQVDDIEFKKRRYDNDSAYRQSKQANRMLARSFADKFVEEGKSILVYSCHPGDANTKLSNSLGFGGSESAEQAAATPIWLASDKSVGSPDHTGKYFKNRREAACEFSADKQSIQQLWGLCREITAKLDGK